MLDWIFHMQLLHLHGLQRWTPGRTGHALVFGRWANRRANHRPPCEREGRYLLRPPGCGRRPPEGGTRVRRQLRST
jgi:hypothetical protein